MLTQPLTRLTRMLGKQQATLELKWMRNTGMPLDEMVHRRLSGEPLQYILGDQPFGGLNLKCRAPTLIPRPETESWALRLAERLKQRPRKRRVLDLGTGTGCIPLLLCQQLPAGTIAALGVDVSPDAVKLANENAVLTGFDQDSAEGNTFRALQMSFLHADFPTRIQPPFDVVVSNPPYIPLSDLPILPPSVRDFEDPRALFGGDSGLDCYRAIARLLATEGFLAADAVVALEFGDGQAEHVEGIFRGALDLQSTIWLDPWNKQRTLLLTGT